MLNNDVIPAIATPAPATPVAIPIEPTATTVNLITGGAPPPVATNTSPENISRWDEVEETTLLGGTLQYKSPGAATLTREQYRSLYSWADENVNGAKRLNRSQTQITSKLGLLKEVYTAFKYYAELNRTGKVYPNNFGGITLTSQQWEELVLAKGPNAKHIGKFKTGLPPRNLKIMNQLWGGETLATGFYVLPRQDERAEADGNDRNGAGQTYAEWAAANPLGAELVRDEVAARNADPADLPAGGVDGLPGVGLGLVPATKKKQPNKHSAMSDLTNTVLTSAKETCKLKIDAEIMLSEKRRADNLHDNQAEREMIFNEEEGRREAQRRKTESDLQALQKRVDDCKNVFREFAYQEYKDNNLLKTYWKIVKDQFTITNIDEIETFSKFTDDADKTAFIDLWRQQLQQ